jgi:hypothetical protein
MASALAVQAISLRQNAAIIDIVYRQDTDT